VLTLAVFTGALPWVLIRGTADQKFTELRVSSQGKS
jgi:hypothetical protein